MDTFKTQAAARIAAVSLTLAVVTTPLAWTTARESAESSTISMAIEESNTLLQRAGDYHRRGGAQAGKVAEDVAQLLAGSLFEVAKIYDREGRSLAIAYRSGHEHLDDKLPPSKAFQKQKEDAPASAPADMDYFGSLSPKPSFEPTYDSVELPDGKWALRVVVPLHEAGSADISGFFEGVRIIPAWQEKQISASAWWSALLAGLASMLCGLVLYPVVIRLSDENSQRARALLDSYITMMEALGRAIAKRDSDTGAHNYRVAWIAARIAEEMGEPKESMRALISGSFLHDVGKIGIPDAILLKPGKLTAEEFDIMKTHVTLGEDIVDDIQWLDGAVDVVAGHHEKWNGTGYPRRLAGENIPKAARIFAVADVFDALCSKRPYKDPMPFEDAMAILHKDSGSHFDPAVVAAFDRIAHKIRDALAGGHEDDARTLLKEQMKKYFY